ncbi:histone-lysine N-methyltransferase EHMT1-like isoform X1 [Bombyx mandarina]|uniref:Histone-lysine N-methyltransferase EHMT1-like isoform X1 n=2 Tax=Bombyx mandarina TaxID=7092 RepID=A0A6J2JPU5_BOMMA|nr:histone-lysine N-methyltransferase EHMT1-like isoform X1 [Bombyx mandarina]
MNSKLPLMCSEAEKAQLFEAIDNNNVEKADVLLSSTVDVNVRSLEVKNRTALHLAAHAGRYDLVALLVDKHKADVNIEDSEGDIPLQLATDRHHMKIVKFLLSRNSKGREYAAHFLNTDEVEEFFQAAKANDIQRVTELLDSGVDVNSVDLSDLHRSALHVAAREGHYDLVQLLLERGADMQYEDDTDECAYHIALNNDHDNIGSLLLKTGYIPDPRDDSSVSSDTNESVSLSFLFN